MVLPDDFLQRGRPHPDRQWRCGGQPLLGALLSLRSEQPVTEEGLILIHTATVPRWIATAASSALPDWTAHIAVITPGAQQQHQDPGEGDASQIHQELQR